jgi:mannose-1-phosphate guanylyltransferase
MKYSVYTIIMAGGGGTRFWPYSRNRLPKQFLDILGTGKSLLQMTYERFIPFSSKENILVVTNEIYYDLVRQHLPDIPLSNILLEPVRRNTAPCIAYASYKISEKEKEAITVVTPADHAIFQEVKFQETIQSAISFAEADDRLLTLGIKPTRPETGYGYIQHESLGTDSIKKVKTFTEKPQQELAEKFLESGDFLWNSGMFIWKLSAIRKAFDQHLPDMAEIFAEGEGMYFSAKEKTFIDKIYPSCRNISIDYGVMEKAENVFVAMGDFGWSDLGSWESIYEHHNPDTDGNVSIGNALSLGSSNCLVSAPEGKLVVVEGQKNLLVLDYDDILLVTSRGSGSKIKEIMAEVKKQKGEEFL